MAVSKSLRFQIFRRDNHTCRYCGASAPDATLRVDHVVPTTLGGSDDPSNLVTACHDCNAGKSATPADAALVADVAQDAMRWAAAMQLATDQAMQSRDAQIEVEQSVWEWVQNWSYVPADWFSSIGQFLAGGLHGKEIEDAARSANGNFNIPWASKWRYFCGICWKKIGKRRDEADALVRPTSPQPVPAGHVNHCPEDCELLNTPDDACPECEQHHCEWYCGYYAGRSVWEWLAANRTIEDDPGARGYAQMSRVCDGAMLAEMGL